MEWTIQGLINDVETFAQGRGIRELQRLVETYGGKNWRKCKGFATLLWEDGSTDSAELHWYEAHGIGKVEIKIKCLL
jgi:hypothetical protein